MIVTVLTETDEAAYNEFVYRCPNAVIQHTLLWKRLVSEWPGEDDVYLIARDEKGVAAVLPLFVYHGKWGNVLLSIPLPGWYGGVLTDRKGKEKKECFHAILKQLLETAEEKKCLLTTICSAPFDKSYALYQEYFAPDFSKDNFYQYIDLADEPLASLTAKRRSAIKSEIRHADAHFEIVTDDRDDCFERWYEIYRERLLSIGAPFIERDFFEKLRKIVIAAGKGRFYYAMEGQTLVGGTLFVFNENVIDYFATGFTSTSMKRYPGSLILHRAMLEARQNGIRFFNWQSSPSRNSGVYRFKARWGSLEGNHQYLTKITGNINSFRRKPLDRVREMYRWHYLMPYEMFISENDS